jgi:hypothetical protein
MIAPLSMRRTTWGLRLATILLCGVSGCARTADVQGTVTHRGRPVIAGSVFFVGADNAARAGVIEPDGTYAIDGVPPGPVKVAIVSQDPAKGRSIQVGDKVLHRTGRGKRKGNAARKPLAPAKGWFPLPAEVGDPERSGLTFLVSPGRATLPIELK